MKRRAKTTVVDPLEDARVAARSALTLFEVTRPEQIDLDAIADKENIEIVFDDLDGATASVLRIGSATRIRISKRILDVGAQRFSIAHELAHLWLRHEIANGNAHEIVERLCTPLHRSRKIIERAASVFASEFLMPEQLVKQFCLGNSVTLDVARAIARAFNTSTLASASRLVEMSKHRCALVYSELGRVRWFKRSKTFPAWIPQGRALDRAAIVSDYHDGGVIDRVPQLLDARVWLPEHRIDGSFEQIMEHSEAIPELGTAYSLLWIPDPGIRNADLAA
jgi:hypothetical protein